MVLLATALWGASSAALAEIGGFSATTTAVVALGGASSLIASAAVRGARPWHLSRERAKSLAVLGCLEAINLVLYIAALRVGPLPVVVALHLSAPLLLLAWWAATRRRRMTRLVVVEALLVTGALTLLGLANGNSSGKPLLGSVLALGSACALAVLIVRVAAVAPATDPDAGAGFQLGSAAVLTGPLLFLDVPSGEALLKAALVGFFLLGPGFGFYWRGLRIVRAPTASVLGLAESAFASLVAVGVFAIALDWHVIAAALGISLAIAVELALNRDSHVSGPSG